MIIIYSFINIEILGPNKDVTNIDNEIEEAEEFLNEDQMSLIRSIVVDDPLLKTLSAETLTKVNPTLRSLGFAKAASSVAFNDELEINSDDDLSSDGDSGDEFDDNDFDNDEGLCKIQSTAQLYPVDSHSY